MSCATLAEAPMASPATTARIVAKATAETTANRIVPPTLPAPPPSACASSGVAPLPAAWAAAIACGPTTAAAPKPRIVISNRHVPCSPITQTAERRAVTASGTV
jgi:hypothetical protein